MIVNENAALYALADMVNQFAYTSTFRNEKCLCDGGLSALENAFYELKKAGCKVNSNGTIQQKELFRFMKSLDRSAL